MKPAKEADFQLVSQLLLIVVSVSLLTLVFFFFFSVIFHFEKEILSSIDVARHPSRYHAHECVDGHEIRPR